MTVAEQGSGVVATAAAELAAAQRRVDGLLTAGAWDALLSSDARDRLVRLGHFPQYAVELDWTPRQVAGHLRDSARIFAERIGRIRAEDEPALPDFVTDAPERLAGYATTPVEQLVAQLRVAQAALLGAVASVPATELDRAGVHEVDGRVTLADLLRFLPGHQRDHAEQLTALMAR
jgi:hypothetical protein